MDSFDQRFLRLIDVLEILFFVIQRIEDEFPVPKEIFWDRYEPVGGKKYKKKSTRVYAIQFNDKNFDAITRFTGKGVICLEDGQLFQGLCVRSKDFRADLR